MIVVVFLCFFCRLPCKFVAYTAVLCSRLLVSAGLYVDHMGNKHNLCPQHSTSNQREVDRVLSMGGTIVNNRVRVRYKEKEGPHGPDNAQGTYRVCITRPMYVVYTYTHMIYAHTHPTLSGPATLLCVCLCALVGADSALMVDDQVTTARQTTHEHPPPPTSQVFFTFRARYLLVAYSSSAVLP